MKQGRFTSLEDFASEVIRQEYNKIDIAAKADSLQLVDRNTLIHTTATSTTSMEMSKLGHEQLASRLNIPKTYYDRMLVDYPELLITNANYLIPKVSEGYFVRALDGKVRAVLSPKFKPIDNYPALEVMVGPLQAAGFELASAEITDTHMYFKVISPKLVAEVKKGDVVQAGFWFKNSEVGKSRFAGGLFFNRLVCSNGLILSKDYGFARNHSGKAIDFSEALESYYSADTRRLDQSSYFSKMKDVITGMICSPEGFRAAVQRFAEAANDQIVGSETKALDALALQLSLNKEEKDGVLRSLIKGGDTTRWGVANAFTDYSKSVLDYDRATDFEVMGGKIIELPTSDWQKLAA